MPSLAQPRRCRQAATRGWVAATWRRCDSRPPSIDWQACRSASKPASRAGLGAGDVIVKVDKHVITNIHDYMFALGELEPGRETTVEVDRAGKSVSLKVVPAPGQGAEPHPREKQDPSGTPAQSPHKHP